MNVPEMTDAQAIFEGMQKQALQMPVAFTTPPVKMAYRSVRRRSGMPKI
jgi:hypothetical protein